MRDRWKALEHINRQRRWIQEHGGTEAGYVARYGSKNNPEHYGDGGEDIYAADMAYLQTLLERARQMKEEKPCDQSGKA